ncbi:DUF3159 domain-containing protein [Streptomyces cyaneofuscatus]|uniref:DUF3159 domain-containing protein n=1 Tax=Streptomyces TaxID=1883 RepID=UPI000978FA05|nr:MULTISPECIES: DUF3159 domain-containing protein [unclassified Streptomyces]ONI49758.1 hypothetical protein STIB_60560 [Streptomyces sp. IB2014 011-1]RDV48314.1 DUF3159 domain-containing protein [Streptomyces sp. IB2014 011-12]CAD5935580.1 conserved membrane protein of unknown function [Streptomyces sp. KY70]CAD5987910.1 conserved membrane protein of unknown function [Streptomyces sp. KY75]
MTSLDKPTSETDQPHPTDRQSAGGRHAAQQDAASKAVTEAALFEAFGGVRGMVETVLPGLLFVTIFTINKDLHISAIAALAVSLALVAVRLIRRDTVKHAFSGVFGVAFGVVFAMMTGNAKDFYLPGMLYTLGLAVAYLGTAAAGVPLIGLILGPVFKENLSWRTRNPGRKKAYTKASYAWGLILLTKCAILFPLYWWADTTQFGWVLIALKIPPFLLAVYLTWVFLAKAPPPIDVFAEMEAEEKAAEQAEKDRKAEQAAAALRNPEA